MLNVFPESESGPENASELTALVPLPTKIPERVVLPVPPLPTPSVPANELSDKHVPPIEKHPAVMFTPLAIVVVPVLLTLNNVVVALAVDDEIRNAIGFTLA